MSSTKSHQYMAEGKSQADQTPSEGIRTHPLAEHLVEWFVQNGGRLSPDVQIVYSDPHGFHMRAARPLSSPILASCPLQLTFSCLNLDPNQTELLPIKSALQQCQGQITDHILTYLLLIEQRELGANSPWHAYIACLPGPESMTTPLWFDKEDDAFLEGTGLAPAAAERKEELHRQWEQAVAALRRLGIGLADAITLESLQWAATIFTSRAFISTHILPETETIPILFPVIDILNHSVSAKVEWDFQPHSSFSLKCLEGDTVKPGDELFNNYAPKQNDELFLGYGFCLENNPIEQFALKLAFPPSLQQYAQEMGLLNTDTVPFGMSSEFLTTDPNKAQHFLRAKGHPFGRYKNHIPFLRGIPSYIVHFFFIQTLLALDLLVQELDMERPGIKVTLHVLLLLHQALERRSQRLLGSAKQEPKNEKQRYASIYRDGQARIICSVRDELRAAIARVRAPIGSIPPQKSALISTVEGLATLESEFAAQAKTFRRGLKMHDLQIPEDESMIWTLLLTVFISLALTTNAQKDSLITSWLHDSISKYPLPTLEEGIEDAETYAFVDENLGDFVHLTSSDFDASPSDVLDNLGLRFVKRRSDSATPVFIKTRTENLGVRTIMWAMKVAEQEVLPLFEDGVVKKCLYVRPWRENGDRSDEEWIYAEEGGSLGC